MTRWNDVSLFINATPDDGIDHYDIWHNGGPGCPMLTAQSRGAADAICAAVIELLELRAEVERLRGERDHFREAWAAAQVRIDCGVDGIEAVREERAAVVAYLRETSRNLEAGFDVHSGAILRSYADRIENGEHRREGEK